jgi:hypothetical protein
MTFDVRENERKMSVYAGVFGLFNFAAVVAEMKGANLSSPRLCAATMIATQLVGSFLVITNVAGLRGWAPASSASSPCSASPTAIRSGGSRSLSAARNCTSRSNMSR